jgi:LysM repeat protein
MDKEKKFCFCITRRRVISAVILVASVLNLIIVGAAFDVTFPEAALTATASPTVAVITRTFSALTATQGIPLPVTATPTDTSTPTATFTPTPTYTFTATATDTSTPTNTPLPTPTACVPTYWWPVYLVQRGDTLSSIGRLTGSTVNELMLANCLLDSRIVAGGKLYVPRLPILTATVTPTSTPTTFVDTLTDFRLYSAMDCDPPGYVSFSVFANDPEGVSSVMVQVYSNQNVLIAQIDMVSARGIYIGSGLLVKPYTVYDVGYYQFQATDGFKNTAFSKPYSDRSSYCYPIPTATPTATLVPLGLQQGTGQAQ